MSSQAGGAERGALLALARDFGYLACGQAALKLLAFVFGVWVVRQLGADDFGRYLAALAFAGLFAVATGPGAASFGTREMAAAPEALGRLVADIAGLRTLLAAAVVPLLWLAAWAIGQPPRARVAIVVASLGLPLYVLIATLDSALVARGRVPLVSALTALRQLAFIACGAAVLSAGARVLGLLWAANAALLLRLAVTGLALARSPGVRLEAPRLARWPHLSRQLLPFSLEGMADLVCLHTPMVVLALCGSAATVGYYGAAFNLVLAVLPLVQSAGTALAPRLNAPGGRSLLAPAVSGTLRLTLLLGLPGALLGSLLAEPLVLRLYGPAFLPAAACLRLLVWVPPVLFLREALRAAALALRLEAAAARIALLGALLTLVLALVLVPRWGASGAAAAFLALRVVAVSQFAWLLHRELPREEARSLMAGWLTPR